MAIASQKMECIATKNNGSGHGHNYGILCHRQYVDRVREALLPSDGDDWSKVATAPSFTEAEEAHSEKPSQRIKLNPPAEKCIVIPTPEEKGPRKSRTGYSLLVLRGTAMSPAALPPMARKQLSWAGRWTHESVLNGIVECNGNGGSGANASSNLQLAMEPLAREIWDELTKTYDAENNFFRIDVQPKSFNSAISTAFTAVVNEKERTPIKLACSASKVTHVVNIIIQTTISTTAQSSPTTHKVYWGISYNKEHFEKLNETLNHNATNEVVLEPTDAKTGLDERKDVAGDAPVSRAYYKLAQVFEDDNLVQMIASMNDKQNNNETLDELKTSILSHGTGLDIGASPGGWTQVLHNTLGIPNVVAIDPALLPNRVLKLSGVNHIRAMLPSEESINDLAKHAPYSTIVCDASMSNANEMLVKIADSFDKVSSLVASDKSIFAWPLCLVVTLKLPYKTETSINRNMEKVKEYVPDCLRRIASAGSSSAGIIDASYRICHLFANSISERTLIAVFHTK